MHLVAWLPMGVSGRTAARQAARQDLSIRPVSQCSLRPLPRDGLMLGFAGAAPGELRAGVRTLARALRS